MSHRAIIPPIIYGTAWKNDRTSDLVCQALEAGFRGVDTACQPRHYSEALVGEALQKIFQRGLSRDEIFIQTKFTPEGGQDAATIPYDPTSSLTEQVQQSFRVSQSNLKTSYVDSLVLHSPLSSLQDLLEVWRAMEEIQSSGGARLIGISNCYDPKLLKTLFQNARVKPAVVQNRFYRATNFDRDLRAFCRENDIAYQSFWTLTANPDILNSPTLESLAAKYSKTPAQVFFRCLTQWQIVPLTGTTSPLHMKQDLEISTFELSQEDCLAIDRLL